MAKNAITTTGNGMTAVSAEQRRSLQRGYKVVLVLKPGATPTRVYGGQVQGLDEIGVRVTLLDWVIGQFLGHDLWAPWSNVESMLVYTPDHDLGDYAEMLATWQHEMREYGSPEERDLGQENLDALLERFDEWHRDRGGDFDGEPPRSRSFLPPLPTFIYFAQCGDGGPIKIGMAQDIPKRLASIQSMTPGPLRLLGSEPGGREEEQALHRRFAPDRLHGEWFTASAALLAYIEGLER